MAFDNSFDYQDLYPRGSDERNYYDDVWYDNDRNFEQERRDYEKDRLRDEGRPAGEPLFRRYNNSPGTSIQYVPRDDGYGHGVQEEQVDQNDDDMSQLQNPDRYIQYPTRFTLWRTRRRTSNWF